MALLKRIVLTVFVAFMSWITTMYVLNRISITNTNSILIQIKPCASDYNVTCGNENFNIITEKLFELFFTTFVDIIKL